MRNAILVDFRPTRNWVFQKVLEKQTNAEWEIVSLESNHNHQGTIQNLLRYCKYFFAALRFFLHRGEFERVVAWQQFHGIFLAFLQRLFNVKKTINLTIMTFIYKPKKSLLGKLYFWFVHFAVTSGYVDTIVVFSESEKLYYSDLFHVDAELFECVFLGVEDAYRTYENDIIDGDYCVSAGRSNRDYGFLINAWGDEKGKLLIICDNLNYNGNQNITVKNNCYGGDYMRALAGAHVVIISLESDMISSGQLVLLHAMMLGKPVIMTNNSALGDYLQNGVTGFVIEKSQEQLDEVLRKLEDKSVYARISKNARDFFLANCTLAAEAEQIAAIINKQA